MYENYEPVMHTSEDEYAAAGWYGTLTLLARHSDTIDLKERGIDYHPPFKLCQSLGERATHCTLSLLSSWVKHSDEYHHYTTSMQELGVLDGKPAVTKSFLDGYTIFNDLEQRKRLFGDTEFGRLEDITMEFTEYHAPIIDDAIRPGSRYIKEAIMKTNMEINMYVGLYDPARPLPSRLNQKH